MYSAQTTFDILSFYTQTNKFTCGRERTKRKSSPLLLGTLNHACVGKPRDRVPEDLLSPYPSALAQASSPLNFTLYPLRSTLYRLIFLFPSFRFFDFPLHTRSTLLSLLLPLIFALGLFFPWSSTYRIFLLLALYFFSLCDRRNPLQVSVGAAIASSP